MSVDPRLFEPFVTLADELHFGRAAARLHVSQPALSQQVQRLETQLGVLLFVRTRQTVAMTAAGESMLPYARQAVAAAAALRDAAASTTGGQAGTVRVGLSPGVHYLAERVLARFGRARPRARVQARVDNSGAIADEVSGGGLEVAIGFATAPTPGVRVEHLADAPALLAVDERHPLAGAPPLTLRELRAGRHGARARLTTAALRRASCTGGRGGARRSCGRRAGGRGSPAGSSSC
jgi:DNA-binding transcriptional LysR family regulator